MIAFFLQFIRNSIEAFCNAARNGCQRVAVTAEGYCGTNNILKAVSFQKSRDGLRHCFHAGFCMIIIGSDFIAGAIQRITKFIFNIFLNLRFAVSCSCQENGTGSCFSPLYSFRMVVGHFGRKPCCMSDSVNIVIEPCCRGHTHCRTIPKTIIGLALRITEPKAEPSTVPRIRIHLSKLTHTVSKIFQNQVIRGIWLRFKKGFSHRQSHHRIIGVGGRFGK